MYSRLRTGAAMRYGLAMLFAGLSSLSYGSVQEAKAPALDSLKSVHDKAEEGDVVAQGNLASMYERGQGNAFHYTDNAPSCTRYSPELV